MSELPAAELALVREAYGDVTIERITPLVGGERTNVSRVTFLDADGARCSVVTKRYVERGENSVREPATLRLLRERNVPGVAQLIAESDVEPVVLLGDAGEHPTLAELLLDDSPGAARAGLLGWAETLGRLHAKTSGLRDALERELAHFAGFGAPATDEMPHLLATCAGDLATPLGALGMSFTDDAALELAEIARLLDVAAGGAITPADTCADNALVTPEGVVLLDFEGGQFRHVAWDVAYLFVPWPSCWCSWRIPDEVALDAHDAWRSQAVPAADDTGALDAARIGWAFISLGWFLPRALSADDSMHPGRPAGTSPARRSVIQHRMASVGAVDDSRFPALRELSERTLAALQGRWDAPPLDVAPAFR